MKRTRNIIYYTLIVICLISPSLWAAETLYTEIHGISGDALKNVLSRLEIAEHSYANPLSTADSQDLINNAQKDIRKALEPYGYFKAKVSVQRGKKGKIIFDITPGPALKIAQIDLKVTGPGKADPKLQNYITHFPLTLGQPLLIESYDKAKEQLFQIANDQGYLKATLEKKEIRINLKNYTATIIMYFNTGSRYYFGNVIFGPSPFAPEFLQRFVSFRKNEPFSSQQLLKFKQNLRNSRYFQQVEAAPDFNQIENLNIPIKVSLTAPKSQRYDVGIGYGTFTGPRLTLGTDFRRVTNTGQHFNAQLKLSSVLSNLSAKYYIPGNNPITDQYTLGANIQYFAPKNGSSFSQTLSASYQKNIDPWQNVLSLNYLNERYKIENETTHISQVLYPSLTLSRIKTDNIISPSFGSMLNFTIQGASQNFLSKTNFFQSEIKGKYIFSPTTNSRIIMRGDLGYTIVENLNQLPLTLRYFAGGINSVRGYPFSSIGPGKYLQVASAEYQHRIINNWNGAVFYDVGNASDTFNGAFKRSDGVGIIYQSFIGPIKFYVGRALSKPGKPYSVEFSIGPDF